MFFLFMFIFFVCLYVYTQTDKRCGIVLWSIVISGWMCTTYSRVRHHSEDTKNQALEENCMYTSILYVNFNFINII